MTAKEYLQKVVERVQKDEDITGVTTNLQFELDDEQYTINVAEGKATFEEGLVGTPEVTLKASPENLVKIAQGELNPMTAMMFGKLKVSNPGAMLKYAKMLGLM